LEEKRSLCVFENLKCNTLRTSHLKATHTVHLRLVGKLVVVFLFVLNGVFFARCYGWGATSEYW